MSFNFGRTLANRQKVQFSISAILFESPQVMCQEGLFDFNDATIDKRGRVLAAYADGCVTDACKAGADRNNDGRVDSLDNDGTDRGTITRQSGGKTLFAAYDGQ